MKYNWSLEHNIGLKLISFYSVLTLLLLSYTTSVHAQINPDIRFNRARELAQNGLYEQAREVCNEILRSYPDFHDASILKARTYSWEGSYDEAREILKEVRRVAPRNRDALFALIDVEMWSENYPDALRYIDIALADLPNNTHLLYRKALALKETDDETAALLILNQILELDPSYREANDLIRTIERRKLINHIGLGYRGYYFLESDNDPWHFYYAELGRKTRFIGPLIGRVNYAERYELNSLQIEFDAYPTVRPGTYLYLNIGYSPDARLFPVSRFGFELFQSLPASWEFSGGFRLLNFNNKDLLILTGSVSKYFRQYYFSFRPYYSFSSDGNDPNGQSYFLTTKRFFGSSDHYLSLIIGRGYSADLDKIMGGQIYDLGGTIFEAMLLYQMKLSDRLFLRLGAGYKFYEEDALWGNPFVGEGGLIFRF